MHAAIWPQQIWAKNVGQLPQRGTSSPKGLSSPNFRPICLLWPNGWMDQNATW